MRSAKRGLSLCLGFALVHQASCGGTADPVDSNVLVDLTNVRSPQTTKVTVNATLNSMPAMSSVDLNSPFSQFGFTMSNSISGSMTLAAQTFDADGCDLGSGQTQVTLPNAYTEITLPITPQNPRKCGQVTPCAAGAICPDSNRTSTYVLWGMFAISDSDIWAVGDDGITMHYDGTAWKTVPSPTTEYLNAVWASGPNDVWAVGETGLFMHNDGTGWSLVSVSNALYDLNGIWGFGPNDIWVVGTNEFTWHYNGSTWSSSTSPPGSTGLYGVWGSATNDVWAAGKSGVVLHYTGGTGSTAWATVSGLGTTSDLRFVWGKSAGQVYVVGANGTILFYNGSVWNRMSNSPTGSTLNAVIGNDSGVYIVGNNGVFLQSTAAPYTTFTLNSSGITTSLDSMALGKNGFGWVGGASLYLGHFDTRP